jgi:fucose permease
LVSLSVQFFVNGAVYASLIARLPEIRDQVEVSVDLLGLILSAGAMTGLAGSFFVGPVIRTLGTRSIMIVGELLYVCALPIIGFSTSWMVLVIGLIALALVDVFIDVAMNVQASTVSSRRHRPVMSRLHGVWSMGSVIGGLVAAGVAAAQVVVHLHLVVVSAVLAVAVLAIRSGLLRPDEQQAVPSQAQSNGRRRRLAPAMVALGLASAVAVPLDVVPGEWAAFRLADDFSAGAALAAAAFTAYTIGATAGGFAGDAFVARTGRTRLLRIAAVLSATSVSLASLIPSVSAALAGFFLAGFGVALIGPQLAEAAALAPGRPGSGFAVLFIGNRAAGLLAPIAMGTVAGATGGIGLAMVLLTVPCAVILIAVAATAVPANDKAAAAQEDA